MNKSSFLYCISDNYYYIIHIIVMERMQLERVHVVNCFENSLKDTEAIRFSQGMIALYSLIKRYFINRKLNSVNTNCLNHLIIL